MTSQTAVRTRLAHAGLERHADALLALAAPSVRLRPAEGIEPQTAVYRHSPVGVGGLSGGVVMIAGGGFHSLALMSDGSVMAWGDNERGQLGDGTRRDRSAPVAVRGLEGVRAIAAGASHSLALLADGSVVGWGDNGYGELCDGTREHRHTPVAVRDLDGGVTAIVAATNSSLALLADGSVVGWGLSGADKVNIWHIPDRPVPVRGLGGRIVAVAATGSSHRLALTEHGVVLAWGLNSFGVLGDGTKSDRFSPGPVSGLSGGVVAIAAGDLHNLALLSDGSVVAWGENISGALGDSSATRRLTPVPVTGLEAGVSAIAAGRNCSFAVKRDGAALCWGWNYQGQLGDASATNRHSPVAVHRLGSGVIAIAPRVALRADGSVVAWGGEQPTDEPGADAELPLGATRLGGRPDLPPGAPWPTFEGRPMAFLAQIDLGDVGPLDERGLLPRAGLLSFFCASADLGRQGGWHVSFTDAGSSLSQAELPVELPAHDRFAAVGLSAERELSLAPCESSRVERLGVSREEVVAYCEALEDERPIHRMLGHPAIVQSDPRDEDPDRCLLLQVDSDDAAGMMWGDVGRLYFWMRPDDLEARRFEACWLDFQSS